MGQGPILSLQLSSQLSAIMPGRRVKGSLSFRGPISIFNGSNGLRSPLI